MIAIALLCDTLSCLGGNFPAQSLSRRAQQEESEGN
jgi:hypothetical protein